MTLSEETSKTQLIESYNKYVDEFHSFNITYMTKCFELNKLLGNKNIQIKNGEGEIITIKQINNISFDMSSVINIIQKNDINYIIDIKSKLISDIYEIETKIRDVTKQLFFLNKHYKMLDLS